MSKDENNHPTESWIVPALDNLRSAGLERRLRTRDTADLINFAGNDYLNLASAPQLRQAAVEALEKWGTGASASRLLSGTLPGHTTLENKLAETKGYPAAVIFGSGYMANLGAITTLAGRHDLLVADRLAHASIMDAALLSRARLQRFRHNDLEHLEQILRRRPAGGRCLIITESVFSMDGDCAPLPEIARLAEQYHAMLMVDEAHATGVFGPAGAGLVRACKLEHMVNISMGTMSKALGSYGGFCACSRTMRDLLVNRARSLIFSTAPPPSAMSAAMAALEHLEKHPDGGAELLRRAALFRERLQAAGLDTGPSASQIVPLIAGDNQAALQLSAALRRRGILAPAIRPPTVPPGSARLRFSITLAHSPEMLAQTADMIIKLTGGVDRS